MPNNYFYTTKCFRCSGKFSLSDKLLERKHHDTDLVSPFFGLGSFSPGLCDDHLAKGILESQSVPVNFENLCPIYRFLQCTVPTTQKIFWGRNFDFWDSELSKVQTLLYDSYVAYELSH